jgi:hypothetical protein
VLILIRYLLRGGGEQVFEMLDRQKLTRLSGREYAPTA